MKFFENSPAREYQVGQNKGITIKDCGKIELSPNEQVTFKTESDAEYDVARKDWGFYATPSLNGRLKDFHLKTALVCNSINKYYIMLIEKGKEDLFEQYLSDESLEIVSWIDTDESLNEIKLLKRNRS